MAIQLIIIREDKTKTYNISKVIIYTKSNGIKINKSLFVRMIYLKS